MSTEHKVEPALIEAQGALLGYVRKKVGDEGVAEDILQESIIKAIKGAPSLREEEKILAWFYRILDNSITDYFRRRRFERRHFEPIDDEETGGAVPPEDFTRICSCIRLLLSSMNSDYAMLIEELELAEGDPAEVAERLGITRNNLKVRRHRARAQLRERLERACRACAEHGCLDCSCKEGG